MNVQTFLRKHSSTILTCIGAVGVIATSVMAVKATPKALTRIKEAEEEKGDKLTKLEVVNVAGPAYIPAVVTGAATVVCIFGANILNKRQQAMLTSGYALLNQSYQDYKRKVDELYGKEAGEHVRAEIAKDKYEAANIESGENTQLFYDFYSGRYFNSTKEIVHWAEYEINRTMALDGGAHLNEFYSYLDLEPLPEYDGIGWSAGYLGDAHWHQWIEFEHETVCIDDDDEDRCGLECTIIHMPFEPFPGFLDY